MKKAQNTVLELRCDTISKEFVFNISLEKFKTLWNQQVDDNGYFDWFDNTGKHVFVNPEHFHDVNMEELF